MKTKVFLVLICICFSCKSEKNQTKNVKNNSKNYTFTVSMDVLIPEDDKIQLFYVDGFPEEPFKEDRRIVKIVKGDENYQTITFALPEYIVPYKLRLDLGEYGKTSIIQIKEINIKFNNHTIQINQKVLDRFFNPNIYLELKDQGYLRKNIEGRYDPFLVSTALLNKKMELEF